MSGYGRKGDQDSAFLIFLILILLLLSDQF